MARNEAPAVIDPILREYLRMDYAQVAELANKNEYVERTVASKSGVQYRIGVSFYMLRKSANRQFACVTARIEWSNRAIKGSRERLFLREADETYSSSTSALFPCRQILNRLPLHGPG